MKSYDRFCPAVCNYDQAFEKAPLSALAGMMSFQTLPRADVSACDWRADLRSALLWSKSDCREKKLIRIQ